MPDKDRLREQIQHLDQGVEELVSSGESDLLDAALTSLRDTVVAAASARLRNVIERASKTGSIDSISVDAIYYEVHQLRHQLMCSYTRAGAVTRSAYG